MTTSVSVLDRQRGAGGRQDVFKAIDHQAHDTETGRNVASTARVVREALTGLAASSDNPRARRGLQLGHVDEVVTSLDWTGFTLKLGEAEKYIAATMKRWGRQAVPTSPRPIAKADAEITATISTVFDAVDEYAIEYAQQRAGLLVAGITTDTRLSIVDLIVNALRGNMTVDQLGRRLRDDIPLTPDDSAAVDAYHQRQFERLVTEGRTPTQAMATATSLSDRYAAKKLAQRTETIARTELIAAANRGRYAGWQGTIDNGWASTESLKRWIAAPDACPECQALDGMLARWDGTFANGIDMPPDHPRCRCTAVLLPPTPELLAEMAAQNPDGIESAAGADNPALQTVAR